MKKINNYLGRNLKSNRIADRISISERSVLMSKIKSKKTSFENNFIGLLKKFSKIKFETNVATIIGKPDIVFKNKKICIFLDSDFWHGWQFPRWRHKMKNKFWIDKIANNRIRDRRITKKLRSNGWKVVRIWEHELRKESKIKKSILFIIQKKAT